MTQPWNQAPPRPASAAAACSTCNSDVAAAFNQIAGEVLKAPFGRYVSAEKRKPGYVGDRSHALPDAEYRKAYLAETGKRIEADRKGRLDKVEAARSAALDRASKVSDPAERKRLTDEAEETARLHRNVIESEARLQTSTAAYQAHYVKGFVSDDDQLYVNVDQKGVAGTARHETLHMMSSPRWHTQIDSGHKGHNLDEAVTEYFTGKLGFTEGRNDLEPQYTQGSQLVGRRYSEQALAKAYFQGDLSQMNREYSVKKSIEELDGLK